MVLKCNQKVKVNNGNRIITVASENSLGEAKDYCPVDDKEV